jgi:hypothetical protein
MQNLPLLFIILGVFLFTAILSSLFGRWLESTGLLPEIIGIAISMVISWALTFGILVFILRKKGMI